MCVFFKLGIFVWHSMKQVSIRVVGVWYAGVLPRQAVWWVSISEVFGMQVCCLDSLCGGCL
jgi:hypothetical protein